MRNTGNRNRPADIGGGSRLPRRPAPGADEPEDRAVIENRAGEGEIVIDRLAAGNRNSLQVNEEHAELGEKIFVPGHFLHPESGAGKTPRRGAGRRPRPGHRRLASARTAASCGECLEAEAWIPKIIRQQTVRRAARLCFPWSPWRRRTGQALPGTRARIFLWKAGTETERMPRGRKRCSCCRTGRRCRPPPRFQADAAERDPRQTAPSRDPRRRIRAVCAR